jgi:hypothetical protein
MPPLDDRSDWSVVAVIVVVSGMLAAVSMCAGVYPVSA